MMHRTCNLIQRLVLGFILVFTILGESVTSESVPDLSPRTVYACEGNEVKIECAEGLRIEIMRSNYGRLSLSVCNEGRSTQKWDLLCMSSKSLGIVSEICSGDKERCQIFAESKKFGDPCQHTPKYLEVQYRCMPGGTSFPVTGPLETQMATKTLSPSASSSSVLRLGSTHSDGSAFRLSSTTSMYNDPEASRDFDSGVWCEEMVHRNIKWPKAWPGQTVMKECPNNQAVRKAIWRCGVAPVKWMNQPDLSQCISPTFITILELIRENEQRFTYAAGELIASELIAFTDVGEQVFGGDLLTVTTAMQKFVLLIDHHLQENNEEKTIQLVHKVNQAILETSSNLLNESRIESWNDIPQLMWPTIATTLLSIIEKCARQVASVTTKPMNLLNIKSNLVVEIRVINTSETVEDQTFPSPDSTFPAGSWASGGSFISLTGKTVQQFEVAGLSKVVFATYNNIDKWLQASDSQLDVNMVAPESDLNNFVAGLNSSPTEHNGENFDGFPWNASESTKDKAVNTRIISASFVTGIRQHVKLREPVVFMMKHITVEQVSNPSCSFWDYSKETMKGHWSTRGCRSLGSNDSHTQCSCQHLTNFAVLMSVNNQQLAEIHKFSLSLITYFGCILSIICLVMAFLTFQFFKNLQCDRNTIHKNLVVTLGVAEVIFLIGIVQYDTPVLCAFVAGILHYLFLVTFFWMCIEGIQLYVMLVEVFESQSSPVKWYYLSAYGIPAIIVIISSIASSGSYGTSTHCWLSTEKGFIWAFVGPVCVIFCINAVMLTVAIYVMCTHASNAVNVWKARQKTTFENVRSWIKGAVVLVVLLGLTWTFGLLYINEQSVFMAYVFTAFNSSQGVFIFVFHCLMNEKVQKEYKRWVRHRKWLPEELRVRCGGVRSSVSVSPIHSSSSGKIMQEQKLSFEYFSRLLSKNAGRKRSSTTTSCSNNNFKRNYNINLQNSLGQDSGDSRAVFVENDSSHMCSDQTEDPYSYMESGHMALGPEHEFYLATGDISMMEGSVADTEYLEDYTKRASSVIDVDKYKIRTKTNVNGKLPETLPIVPIVLSTGQDLKNGTARRIINEKRVTAGESDQLKQLTAYTNLGASGYGLDSSSSRQNP